MIVHDYDSTEGVERIMAQSERSAKDIFAQHGYVPAAAFIFGRKHPETRLPDGKVHLVHLPLATGGDADKALCARFLAGMCDLLDAFAVVTVMESYLVQVSVDELADAAAPSEHPRRQEAVILMCEHRALKQPVLSVAHIDREVAGDESTPGTLRAFVRDEALGEVHSVYSNLIHRLAEKDLN